MLIPHHFILIPCISIFISRLFILILSLFILIHCLFILNPRLFILILSLFILIHRLFILNPCLFILIPHDYIIAVDYIWISRLWITHLFILIPSYLHLNLLSLHLNPLTLSLKPSSLHPNPSSLHLNPSSPHFKPLYLHPNPSGLHSCWLCRHRVCVAIVSTLLLPTVWGQPIFTKIFETLFLPGRFFVNGGKISWHCSLNPCLQ